MSPAQIAAGEARLAALTQLIADAQTECASLAKSLMLARLHTRDAGAAAAVWAAFAGGAAAVRIDGAKGAGTTTLLKRLAAESREHGFSDGAPILTDPRGPASDVAQWIAACVSVEPTPSGLAIPALLRTCGSLNALILLDRATITGAEQAELIELCPRSCFVLVDPHPVAGTPTVALEPLDADAALSAVEAGYGRPLDDADERAAALEAAATVALQPGRTRLVGVAAGELHRTFALLRVEYTSGAEIIRALIASLPPTAQRILGVLAQVRIPLTADLLAGIVGSAALHASLDRLLECELVRACGPDAYELPRYVESLVAPLADIESLLPRIQQALCATFEAGRAGEVFEHRLVAAEALIERAFDQGRWCDVLALGAPLAQRFAEHGMLGAHDRISALVTAATLRTQDPAVPGNADAALGYPAGATLPSAARVPPRPGFRPAEAAGPALHTVRKPLSLRIGAMLGVTAVLVAFLSVWFWPRSMPADRALFDRKSLGAPTVAPPDPVGASVPPPLHISAFSAYPARIKVGESTRLCYAVSGANLLRIVPRVGELGLLRACRLITLVQAHAYTYKLFAFAADGNVAMREARVDVVAPRAVTAAFTPPPSAAARAAVVAPVDALARQAVYQFDVTPAVVDRGQAASLCVGVGRWATGSVTAIGALRPGITRCYRVSPVATTVYRLHVALDRSVAIESVTVAVRKTTRVHQVARNGRR